jgi:hypothetical protein
LSPSRKATFSLQKGWHYKEGGDVVKYTCFDVMPKKNSTDKEDVMD